MSKIATKNDLYNITYGNFIFPTFANDLQCPTKSSILSFDNQTISGYTYSININGSYKPNQLVQLSDVSISKSQILYTGILLIQVTFSSSQTPAGTGVTLNKCVIRDTTGGKIAEYDINLVFTEKNQILGTIIDQSFSCPQKDLVCEIYEKDRTNIVAGATTTYNSDLKPKAGWRFDLTYSLG